MKDELKSSDKRLELDAQGKPHLVSHDSKAEFNQKTVDWFKIDSKPVCCVGSSGPNRGEHKAPKNGNVFLAPMKTSVLIASGLSWFRVGGRSVATESSSVQVPDIIQPIKSGVLKTSNRLFKVSREYLMRGE